MVSDTIGDLIIQLKNAGRVGKTQVVMPYSKLRHAVAQKLSEVGYVDQVAEQGKKVPHKSLAVTLKYVAGAPRITDVKRISKPGRRLYTKVANIHQVKFGKGHMLLSTPLGILTNVEAKAKGVGGEQLFIIW